MNENHIPSILYIDDEESNLRIFRINFKRYYKVFTTSSIQEAYQILRENPISLIITDQKMPEMSGTDFLKSIINEYPDVIRIVLTGFADIQDIIQAINDCHIHQYVTKPYENGEMKNIIDKAIESYNLAKERKDLIEQLKEANERLEEKVAERTAELEYTTSKLLDSINYAKRIQKSVLPTEQSIAKLFKDAFVLYKPKDIVGGDFYAVFDKEDTIIVAVGDCTGHGVPGALMSMLGDALLRSIIDYKEEHSPEKILNLLKEGVSNALRQEDTQNQDGMEVGVLAYHPYSRVVEFSSSRRDLIYFENGEMKEIKADKILIGGTTYYTDEQFTLHTIPLQGETTLYLFSDGYQDQFGGEMNKKIGSKKLKELLASIHHKPMYEQKVFLETFLQEWMRYQPNNEQMDDILVMGIRV
ncbi:MAG: response regulator [Raineya sp.]|nr:response regulator [Raineya sp.]MDW8295779.1 response regulator [Raineya sp.]